MPEWRNRSGMFTVAYGKNARDCARALLASWTLHMPDIPAVIATDAPDEFKRTRLLHVISPACPDVGARAVKLSMPDLVPQRWRYCLYLDADTKLVQPVDFLFSAVAAGWELVICKNPGKFAVTDEMQRPNNEDEVRRTWELMGGRRFTHWNGGVWAYRRCPAIFQMFEDWRTGWMEQANQDQPALHRAIHSKPLHVLTLGNQWNWSDRYDDGKTGRVIEHYQMHARRGGAKKLPPGVRGDSPEAWSILS